jgi:hypothetical protein
VDIRVEWVYLEGLMSHPRRDASPTLLEPTFLDEVLETILAHPLCEQGALNRLAVVVPSHRVMTKLRQALGKRLSAPVRFPSFHALSGFVEESSPFTAADSLEVMARFYQLVHAEQPELTFDRFVPWATVVLSDFAAVDHELADVGEVFQNLADIQGIEDWSFGEAPWSEDQKAFERQWRRLPSLYAQLNEALSQDGMATRAHLTRRVAEGEGRLDADHVMAAGLATMSTAEWNCLQHWDKTGALTLIWDGDASYVDDVHNEAGLFIRKYRSTAAPFPRKSIATSPPRVQAVACSSAVSQAQYVRNVLTSYSPEELDRTLVVLPDGSSLGTVLQSLPAQANGINVTMGVALHETPVVSFVDHIFGMLETQGSGWRLEQVQALHAHPVMLHVLQSDASRPQSGRAIHRLAKAHRAWVKAEDFREHGADAWAEVLTALASLKTPDADGFLHALSVWALEMEGRMEAQPTEFSRKNETSIEDHAREVPWISAGWRRFRTVVAVLERLQHAHAPLTTAQEVRHMAKRLLRNERIDLLGEPNQGLQVMGLTETRALDFERVFVLDMNEGKVPQTSMPDSFLPLDLRHALRMPGPREREARYAYLLHRLMQRSKEVHLLYRGAADKKDGGEPSRYLMQLEGSFHNAQGQPYLQVEHLRHQLPLPEVRPEVPDMAVTDKMRLRLAEWSSQGMSPSAINTMLQCPRNFAYRYLYQMGEATEIQNAMEASTLGSVVHWVMEHGLSEAEGHLLEVHHLDKVRTALEDLLTQALENVYNASLVNRGENVLQLEIARSTLKKLLRQERQELTSGAPAPFIVKLEQELKSRHPGTSAGDLALRGFADRREEVAGIPRVVDYKTGKVEAKELRLKDDWTAQLERGDKSKALQLVVYATMVLATLSPEARERGVLAAIRSGRNVREGLLSLEIDGEPLIKPHHANKFIQWLAKQLEAFAASGHELAHAPDAKYCEHCVVLDPVESHSF